MRATLLHDRAVKLSKAKVHVYTDSVLCQNSRTSSINRSLEATKLSCLRSLPEYHELDRIDGEPVEFEWTIFPRLTTPQLLREIQKTMEENMIQPEKFEDRIIFMSMYKNIVWTTAENKENGIRYALEVQAYAKKPFRTLVIPRTRNRRKAVWNALQAKGLGSNAAEMMMIHLRESGHPIYFEEQVHWTEDLWKSKGGGKLPIHYKGDSTTATLLFRTIISVNQLSVYGAVSDWCEETCTADFRSFVFQYGETRCGDEWRIGVSNLTQCCVNLHESTFG